MKRKGYTLVELMVSITILMIILGTIGLIITSYTGTYNMGMKNEETGNSYQSFYAYLIRDLTPDDEEDEENYVIIQKHGSPMRELEIKRSWHLGTDKESVRYIYSNGEISRSEYRSWDDENTPRSRILRRTRNFDLTGMDLRVSQNSLKYRQKVGDAVDYKEVSSSELEAGMRLGKSEAENAERFNYYIEPVILLEEGNENLEISRGYGLRFGPKIVRTPGDGDGSQENLIWCAKHQGVQIDNNGILTSTTKTLETGKYMRIEVTGQDADKVRFIKANNIRLSLDGGEYIGYVTVPAGSEIVFEIDTSGNSRRLDIKYYVYK